MLFAAWPYATSFPAHGTEDVELPDDEEMRLPKQTVTAKRGRGSSSLAYTIINIVRSGNLSEIFSLGLIGDEYSFAIACQRNPNSFTCDQLKCEIAPNLKECENRLDTIIVTAERPDPNEDSSVFWLNVEYPPVKLSPTIKKNEQTDEEKQKSEQKLKEQCRNAYKKIFSTLNEFNFGSTFGTAVGGSISAIDGRAIDKSKQNSVASKLVEITAPIMTKGDEKHGPVDYKNGQEAVTGVYLNTLNNKVTRGSHLYKGDNDGKGIRQYEKDYQWNFTKEGGAKTTTQKLVLDFHTHPIKVPNQSVTWYVWPSVQDILSHVALKNRNELDQDAFLAIGFMSNNKYFLSLIEVGADIKLKTLKYYRDNPKKYGEFLKLFLNSSSEMIILGDNGKVVDYMNFFKHNKNQVSVYGLKITPSTCDKFQR